ncbi:hypothetical protein BJX76DRAFT_320710 [Aspergillus varians]
MLPTPSPRCMKSPSKSPDYTRRLRLPPLYGHGQAYGHSQGHLYTPLTASPLSANPYAQHAQHPQHHRPSPRHSQPPSDWRFHQLESPATDGSSYSLRQVVTTTITFRVAPRIAAPPVGKKKKVGGRKNL